MIDKPVRIHDDIYRLGAGKQADELSTYSYLMKDLRVNSYLLIDNAHDGGREGILIGAGSAIDFDETYANLIEILPVDKLKYIILHSQDPSTCAALPLLERKGFAGKIVTHLKTDPFIRHYGVKSGFIHTNLSANRLILGSGRTILFANTPFLKSAGSFAAYDTVSKILFSGDIFGALVNNHDIYAGDDYRKEMIKYHAEFMPADHILHDALKALLKKDISMIAPQHGSIINNDILNTISSLMGVRHAGSSLKTRFAPADDNGAIPICNELLTRYFSLFSKEEVIGVFRGSGITIDETTGLLKTDELGISNLWNQFFEIIFSRKGFNWLALIDDTLQSMTVEYGIAYPEIYHSAAYRLKGKYDIIERERNSLVQTLNTIQKEFHITDNKLLKDPLAQVYKEDVFADNLITDIRLHRDVGIDFAFFIFEIDNLHALNVKFGRDAGDEILANAAYLLKNFKRSSRAYAHHLIFRMNGPRFTYYCNDTTRDEIISIADAVRREFRESRLFITDITVSAGVVHSSEFLETDKDPETFSSGIIELANSRLRLAKHNGIDSVCGDSETSACYSREDYIMVIDPDSSVRQMLEAHLRGAGYNVTTCAMGDEALAKIDIDIPRVIISEAMLPKIDGFSLRKKLLEDSSLKNTPFILMSAIKNEKLIIRAQSLGIYHYFQKPYPIIELIGLVNNLSNAML